MKALPIPNTYQVGSKATKDLQQAENGVRPFQKPTALVRINCLKQKPPTNGPPYYQYRPGVSIGHKGSQVTSKDLKQPTKKINFCRLLADLLDLTRCRSSPTVCSNTKERNRRSYKGPPPFTVEEHSQAINYPK